MQMCIEHDCISNRRLLSGNRSRRVQIPMQLLLPLYHFTILGLVHFRRKHAVRTTGCYKVQCSPSFSAMRYVLGLVLCLSAQNTNSSVAFHRQRHCVLKGEGRGAIFVLSIFFKTIRYVSVYSFFLPIFICQFHISYNLHKGILTCQTSYNDEVLSHIKRLYIHKYQYSYYFNFFLAYYVSLSVYFYKSYILHPSIYPDILHFTSDYSHTHILHLTSVTSSQPNAPYVLEISLTAHIHFHHFPIFQDSESQGQIVRHRTFFFHQLCHWLVFIASLLAEYWLSSVCPQM